MKILAFTSICMVCLCAFGYGVDIDDREAGQLLEIRLRWDEGQSKEARKSDMAVVQRAVSLNNKNKSFAIGIYATIARYEGRDKKIGDRIRPAVFDDGGSLRLEEFDCCIEYARSVAGERESEAQNILAQVGNSTSTLPKLLAAEAYGDILCAASRFEAGNELYKLGINFYDADNYAKKDKRCEATGSRLNRKSRVVSRGLDVEKYGEEFVIFREAGDRHKEGNYVAALEKYSDLSVRFPKSIFGMASDCLAGKSEDRHVF